MLQDPIHSLDCTKSLIIIKSLYFKVFLFASGSLPVYAFYVFNTLLSRNTVFTLLSLKLSKLPEIPSLNSTQGIN